MVLLFLLSIALLLMAGYEPATETVSVVYFPRKSYDRLLHDGFDYVHTFQN